jgi:hypothetical protein
VVVVVVREGGLGGRKRWAYLYTEKGGRMGGRGGITSYRIKLLVQQYTVPATTSPAGSGEGS